LITELRCGFEARPVLLGPVSFLLLSKTIDGSDRLDLVDRLVAAYAELLIRLKAEGAEWVQLDEPCLVRDLDLDDQAAYRRAYAALARAGMPNLLLTTYFGGLEDNLSLAMELPVQGLHVDLVRAPHWLDAVLDHLPDERVLSLGLVDGRNVWRSDLHAALKLIKRTCSVINDKRLWLAPSCSLLHVPVDLRAEAALDPTVRSWLAFAREKIEELRVLADAHRGSIEALAAIAGTRELLKARASSPLTGNPNVQRRLGPLAISNSGSRLSIAQDGAIARSEPAIFPTTTIGSFPQS
jgi:5-methyltetrahydropteroyltriglutamate--homocysteine methyltransferase